MTKTHDTLVDLHLGTPGWFTFCARLLPLGLFGQFLSAGIALFQKSSLWEMHAALGGALSVPIIMLFGGSLIVYRLRGFVWWAGLLVLLFVVQVLLAVGGSPLPLSLHPLNGAILLAASFILLFKVERRRHS
ncbi:DUF6220 domain-containing protein [Rhizobium halophilum]|uniref:DUF6220 domain-containing protein n=1 Tax=Rhizobium halophilum TaxID=2846852 RepID=UPI001EFE586A|nr:DUF6220 domain-containing protein [Rhizobium halophilum]MCF6371149.1 DUF6220 domain-containing protein [Rhizobium halophilum]